MSISGESLARKNEKKQSKTKIVPMDSKKKCTGKRSVERKSELVIRKPNHVNGHGPRAHSRNRNQCKYPDKTKYMVLK